PLRGLGRPCPGNVGGFLTLEDTLDMSGAPPNPVAKTSSKRDQTADSGERTLGVDRGKSVAGGKLDDQTALNVCQRTRRHDQTAIARTCKRRGRPLDLAGGANGGRADGHAD